MDAPYRPRRPYTDAGSSVLVISCSSNAFFPFLGEIVASLRGLLPATAVEAWFAEKGADGFLTFGRS